MKSTIVAVGALITLARSQDLSSLPECGRICISNMVSLASTLGCNADDFACLCNNEDFSYGIRDCTNQACEDSQAAADTQEFGIQFCAGEGIAVTSILPETTVQTASGTETDQPTASGETTLTSVISGPTGFTSVFTTVVTSDSTTFTSTGVSVIETSAVPTEDSSASSDVPTSPTSDGNDSTESPTDGSDASTTSTSDPASHQTAAPIGFLAAAGLAALLL